MPENNNITSDSDKLHQALGEDQEQIRQLRQAVDEALADGSGLDPAVAESLRATHQTTRDELNKNEEDAETGKEAADDKDRVDEEGAESVDSVDTSLTGDSSGAGAGTSGLSSPGAGAGTSGGDIGTSTSGASGGGESPIAGVLGGDNASGAGAGAQRPAPSMDPQAMAMRQQIADSQAWQQAMAQQQNQAAMSQMNYPSQLQTLDQAAQVQQSHPGGEEVAPEEIETIIKEMMADDSTSIDTGDGELAESGGLGESQPSGLSVDEVSYDKMSVDTLDKEQIRSYALDACDLNGVTDPDAREKIANVMTAQAMHESGGNTNAGNGWDSNAVGEQQVDGLPAQSSRGPWQTIPETFAAHHMEGTSNSIYDPQASAAAALNYMMDRYGVGRDGSGIDEFAATRGIDPSTGESSGGYIGY